MGGGGTKDPGGGPNAMTSLLKTREPRFTQRPVSGFRSVPGAHGFIPVLATLGGGTGRGAALGPKKGIGAGAK